MAGKLFLGQEEEKWKGKSINYLSSLFSRDPIEDERAKGKWRLCEVVEPRARAKRKLSVTESASA